MAIVSTDEAAVTLLLSSERLGALTQLTGSVQTAIELHQETLRLGASLMNVTDCRDRFAKFSLRKFKPPFWCA
jgi:hypothetical protein